MSEGEDGRPCIKGRSKKPGRGSKEKTEELYISEEEGEEYLSEMEDGRSCIKWRKKKTAESDIKESLVLSKLVDSNIEVWEDGDGGRASRTDTESLRRRTKGGRGFVDDAVETPIS